MKKYKKEEIENCNHVLIRCDLIVNVDSGESYTCYGCIKCGITNQVLYKNKRLSSKEKFMLDYVKNNNLYNGHNVIDRYCDLDLAQAIYNKIKATHPYMDEATIMKYFKEELQDIRSDVKNDEAKEEIAKKLSLKPTFNKWFSQDVQTYKTF